MEVYGKDPEPLRTRSEPHRRMSPARQVMAEMGARVASLLAAERLPKVGEMASKRMDIDASLLSIKETEESP